MSKIPVTRVVLEALEKLKARNIVQLDVSGASSVTDLFIIATGTSSRHVKSLAENIVENAKKAGYMPLGKEGESDSEWILVDLGDLIVHIMTATTREFYDLERLWSNVDAEEQEQ